MHIGRSILKVVASRAGTSLLVFGGIATFARLLSPSEIGVFFLFQASLGFISLPADFGLGDALEKRISEGKDAGDVFATAMLLKLFFATAISAVLLLFRGVINQYLGADLVLFLILGIYTQELGRLATHTLNGELRVSESEALRVLRQVVWILLGVLLVHLGWGADGIVYALLAGSTVLAVGGLLRQSTGLGTPNVSMARSLLDFSRYSFITSASSYIYGWMDVLIIGLLLTQGDVGTYEVAWRVAIGVSVVNRAITTTVYPQMSEWDAGDTAGKIEQLVEDMFLPSLAVSIPAFLGTVVLSRDLLTYLFGPEYEAAWLVLVVLMLSNLVASVHTAYSRVLPAMDRADLDAIGATVSLSVNVVLNVLLVWQFGILGAAVATTVARATSALFEIYFVRQLIVVSVPYKQIAWSVVAALLMTASILFVRRYIVIASLIDVLATVGFGAIVYGSLVLALPDTRITLFSIFTEETRSSSSSSD